MPVLRQPRRVVDEMASGFDLRRHVGQLKLNALKLGDGLAELFARGRVLQREVERTLCDAERQRGKADPAGVERAHEVRESFAFVPEQILRRYLDVVEQQLSRVRCTPPKLVFLFSGTEPGHRCERLGVPNADFAGLVEVATLFRQDEGADAARAGRRIGDRSHDEHFADARVRDEPFGAVQQIVAPLLDGSCPRTTGIASG